MVRLPFQSSRLTCPRAKNYVGSDLHKTVGHGIRYLGYGVMESGKYQRGFLHSGFNFDVRLRVRGPKDVTAFVTDGLTAFGVFGGMGARSRKGFGSVSLQSLIVDGEEKWPAPKSLAEFRDRIKGIMERGRRAGLPQYTAFSDQSRCVLLEGNHHDSLKLLDDIGIVLRGGIRSAQHNERRAFGLPRGKNNQRRASPLFRPHPPMRQRAGWRACLPPRPVPA